MKRIKRFIATVVVMLLSSGITQAARLEITLQPDPSNPEHPVMGDKMHFHSVITNTGSVSIEGLVGWISLVEIDPGQEQPMDLEDWSAHKAVTGSTLAAGAQLETVWPMRLIQHGDYRVVINVTDRNQNRVFTSPAVQFRVTRKPVVESRRILPVAFGLPLLIASLIGYRVWRQRS
jgi:hypothetical protein